MTTETEAKKGLWRRLIEAAFLSDATKAARSKVEAEEERRAKRMPRTGMSFGDILLSSSRFTTVSSLEDVDTDKSYRLAMTNSWAYSDIDLISTRIQGTEFDIKRRVRKKNKAGEDAEMEDVKGHPLQELLASPNSLMSGSFLLDMVTTWYLLRGNGYIFVSSQGPGTGKPVELWPLHAAWVHPRPDLAHLGRGVFAGQIVIDYDVQINGVMQTLPGENIIHWRTVNPWDYWEGLSPLVAASSTLNNDFFQSTWLGSFYGEDNAVPSSIISLPPEITDDVFEEASRLIRSEFAAKRRTAITRAGDMKVEVIEQSIKDQELLGSREFNRKLIDRVFGVPEGLASGSLSGDSRLAAEITFARNTIQPMLNGLASALTGRLAWLYGDADLVVVAPDVVPQDRAMDLQEFSAHKMVMTVNEARKKLNLDEHKHELADVPIELLPFEGEKWKSENVKQPDPFGAPGQGPQNLFPGEDEQPEPPGGNFPGEDQGPEEQGGRNFPGEEQGPEQPAGSQWPWQEEDPVTRKKVKGQGNTQGYQSAGAQMRQMAGKSVAMSDLAVKAAADDLRRWRKVALSEFKAGREPVERPFESEYIPEDVVSEVKSALLLALDDAMVKAVFEEAIDGLGTRQVVAEVAEAPAVPVDPIESLVKYMEAQQQLVAFWSDQHVLEAEKHHGPGNHPSGSSQDVHGHGGNGSAVATEERGRDAWKLFPFYSRTERFMVALGPHPDGECYNCVLFDSNTGERIATYNVPSRMSFEEIVQRVAKKENEVWERYRDGDKKTRQHMASPWLNWEDTVIAGDLAFVPSWNRSNEDIVDIQVFDTRTGAVVGECKVEGTETLGGAVEYLRESVTETTPDEVYKNVVQSLADKQPTPWTGLVLKVERPEPAFDEWQWLEDVTSQRVYTYQLAGSGSRPTLRLTPTRPEDADLMWRLVSGDRPIAHLRGMFEKPVLGFKPVIDHLEVPRSEQPIIGVHGHIDSASGDLAAEFTLFVGKGQAWAAHLVVDPGIQGSGLGTNLMEEWESELGEVGVKSIRLYANYEVGGYTWARMGYDFDYESPHWSEVTDSGLVPEDEMRWRLAEALFKDGEINDPADAWGHPALAAWDKKRHSWEKATFQWNGKDYGKLAMLGSNWPGVKVLGGKGDRIGAAYLEAKAKAGQKPPAKAAVRLPSMKKVSSGRGWFVTPIEGGYGDAVLWDDIDSEADDIWAEGVRSESPVKHYGPGNHPDGSPQSVHGRRGGQAAWRAEHGVNERGERVAAAPAAPAATGDSPMAMTQAVEAGGDTGEAGYVSTPGAFVIPKGSPNENDQYVAYENERIDTDASWLFSGRGEVTSHKTVDDDPDLELWKASEKKVKAAKSDVVAYLAKNTEMTSAQANEFVALWARASTETLGAAIIQEEAMKMFGLRRSGYALGELSRMMEGREELINDGQMKTWSDVSYYEGDYSFPMEFTETDKKRPFGEDNAPLTEERSRQLVRQGLEAMYNRTQEELAAAGVKTLSLYRGLGFDTRPKPGETKLRKGNLASSPLESWSLSPRTASRFGDTVLAADFPVNRVLCTPRTGFGCLYEWEYVVIGDHGEDVVSFTTPYDLEKIVRERVVTKSVVQAPVPEESVEPLETIVSDNKLNSSWLQKAFPTVAQKEKKLHEEIGYSFIGMTTKHAGPGNHPSGSSQDVHGGGGSPVTAADARVDEVLTLKGPEGVPDMEVSYRGRSDGMAVVYDKKSGGQFQVEFGRLRRPESSTWSGPDARAEEWMKRAKKYFGTTNDYFEAGYILPDGTMLDLSGKKMGGQPNERALDHREISFAEPEDGGGDRTDAMLSFMRTTGAIRFGCYGGGRRRPKSLAEATVTINTMRPLTYQQRLGLEGLRGEYYWQVDDHKGYEIEGGEGELWTPRAMAELERALAKSPFAAVKHYGPGLHASGSSQEVHGGDSESAAAAAADDEAWFAGVTGRLEVKREIHVERPVFLPIGSDPERTRQKWSDITGGRTIGDLRRAFEVDMEDATSQVEFVGSVMGEFTVMGSITDKATGERIAEWNRVLEPNGIVRHTGFVVRPSHQGSGIGLRFTEYCEDRYREMGFRFVEMEANYEVGGYAWARMGYDFDIGDPAYNATLYGIQKRLLEAIAKDEGIRDPKKIERLPVAAEVKALDHAWEIAIFEYKGKRYGKQALLGSRWMGVKQLGDEGDIIGRIYSEERAKKMGKPIPIAKAGALPAATDKPTSQKPGWMVTPVEGGYSDAPLWDDIDGPVDDAWQLSVREYINGTESSDSE